MFALVVAGELPDKTMFASLVLASRGRPRAVWVGAAAAFAVHVAIAVTVGGLLTLLPRRAVDVVVAVVFLAGGLFALRHTQEEEEREGARAACMDSARRTILAAFVVIFLAKWGDLTRGEPKLTAAQQPSTRSQPWPGARSGPRRHPKSDAGDRSSRPRPRLSSPRATAAPGAATGPSSEQAD